MAGQVQVQLRVPKETVKSIDCLIKAGKFKSRSDAIKAMIYSFEEKEKTRAFFSMLLQRSEEAGKKENLVPFSEL